MTDTLPTLPTGPLDFLVKAALAPAEAAREAWAAWRQAYTIDETPWNEVRLLGAVAERIGWLEPGAEILPRMKGIQKFLYAQTQICLSGSMDGMFALADAGIPMLVIKGAARVLMDGRTARERLVRDIDVLVPLSSRREAFAALEAAGWGYRGRAMWQALWREMEPTANHHAWSLAKGDAEIDLHHFSNSINRIVGNDDGLWQRASVITWRGLPVHVPSPTDNLIVSIVHGIRWSQECNADWLIDACRSLDGGPIEWDIVLQEAEARQVHAILLTGLRYIHTTLQRDIPANVLQRLEARATPQQWDEVDVFARCPMPRTPEQNMPILAMALARCGPPPVGAYCVNAGAIAVEADQLPKRWNIDIRSVAAGSETARLTVRLTSNEPPGAELIGTLCIMGVVLDCRRGKPLGRSGGSTMQEFQFFMPRRLLAMRGADRICLTVGSAERPAYPPWRSKINAAAGRA